MRNRRLALLLSLVLTAGSVTAQSADQPITSEAGAGVALESLLREAREQYELPAIAAVVVKADSVLGTVAIGVRRLGHTDQVMRTDRFHIGSNGKAIASTVIAKLIEEGVLAWDSRPIDVFPELGSSVHDGFREVTLQQLLGHRAGLPPYKSLKSFRSAERRVDKSDSPRAQRRALSVWLLQQSPDATDIDHYSNAGYTIAAAMAEEAADEPWESLLESRLAKPLKITLWRGQPARIDPAQPWGHRPKSYFGLGHAGQQETKPEDYFNMGPLFGPAGDLALSPIDYAIFLQQHLTGLKGKDGLLQASSIRYLHFGPDGYALGWGESDFDGVLAHTHLGTEGTFVAAVMLLPEHDLAAAVFINSGTPKADKAAREATKAILRLYLPSAPRASSGAEANQPGLLPGAPNE